ncbi:MAG: TetR/AcrR family transcriptional regulator [Caulobacteraceae bacterium]|nr:MAG: TetR/AcrR family transcriptional regulator [Caulobacteraceae bacterium]
MEQILDAAEYLFSVHGLYGVTLKDVAQRVGVHHTLLNYYFTDKKKLYDDVIARRAEVTVSLRMKALEECEAAAQDGKPTVEAALRAFLDTDLDLYSQGGENWKNYGVLGALSSNTPYGAELMDFHFDPVVLKLIDLLKRALPDCAAEDIFWGYHFVTGGLMLTLARTGRINRLSGGLCDSDDFGAVKDRMASFMAAGFMAICRQRANPQAAADAMALMAGAMPTE